MQSCGFWCCRRFMMKEYLVALLQEDIFYDEANPRYRCLFNLYHVAKVSKVIALVHVALLFGFLVSYFPASFIALPVIVTVVTATVHAIVTETALTLLPLYVYLIGVIVVNAGFAVYVFVLSIIDYTRLLQILGYPHIGSWWLALVLLVSVKATIVAIMVLTWWQASVVARCRQYYQDKLEQTNYVNMSVPESFIDTKISEKFAIANGPKVPEYVFYSLEDEDETTSRIDFGSDCDEKKVSEKE